jgi:thiamine biosynthesis protein ThiC
MHQYSADKRSAKNDMSVQKLTKALLIYIASGYDHIASAIRAAISAEGVDLSVT